MERHYRQYKEGESVYINGKEYKFITLRKRSKLVSKDGDLINPFRPNQKVGVRLNNDGYPVTGGGVPVHRYVAYGWVDGWFEGAEVNHIDMNRENCHVDNLEWVTHVDNVKHSANNSNHYSKPGSKNPNAILTEEEVLYIKELFDNGATTMEVVKIFYPDYTFEQRRKVWGRFDYIKKGKSWR